MDTFSNYLLKSFASLYFPKETEIQKKINNIFTIAKEPDTQLIRYRNLENYYSRFYKDQLSAEVKGIVNNIWLMKKDFLTNLDNTAIINILNIHRAKYNKILSQLYPKKYRLFRDLSTNHMSKYAYQQLFHVSMKIIYYSSLRDCIEQLFHRFAAILYV